MGTLAARMFGARTRMRFRHRYEVDPRYLPQLEASGMIFSGKSPFRCQYNLIALVQWNDTLSVKAPP